MNCQRQLLIGLVIAFIVFSSDACGKTGAVTPTVGPAPSIQSTEAPLPTASFTTTITPSLTPTATPVPTDTPAPPPTDTPTPAPTSVFSQQPQSDGSILLQDQQNGYAITFPPNWTILDLASGDLDKILAASVDLNPAVSQMIENNRSLLTKGAGMIAIDTDATHSNNSFSPIILSFGAGTVASPDLPMDFIVEANAQSITQVMRNAQILSTGVGTNKNNAQIGVIEALLPVSTPNGNISIYEKLVLFKAKNGLMVITMLTDQSMQTTLAPVFQSIIDSISVSG